MSDSLINKKEEIEVEVAQGEESSPKSTIYSCRHCSHVLFNELVINPHLKPTLLSFTISNQRNQRKFAKGNKIVLKLSIKFAPIGKEI